MKKIWFKRKYFGWGWYPSSWQGWLATFVYVLVLLFIFKNIDKTSHSVSDTLIGYFIPFVITTVVFILICYKTGEKPMWQWWGKPINKNKEDK